MNTVNPQLSEPRLSGSQNHLARDTWIMQLSHQRAYTVYVSVASRNRRLVAQIAIIGKWRP